MTGRLPEIDNPFWRFSLTVYGRPGVADACIALQETLGVDVNLLLFCAWAGVSHRARLSEWDVRKLMDVSSGWQRSVVQPIRGARHYLKSPAEIGAAEVQALRKQAAALELQAEQVEQALLYASASPEWPRDELAHPRDIARQNLETALRCGMSGDAAGRDCARHSSLLDELATAAAGVGA